MAPVTVKRKSMRFLAPMAKELQIVSQEILKNAGDQQLLIKALLTLANMTWTFEKGDLFQWVSVLDVLDRELGKAEASSDLVLEVLRCCRVLLENCSNRHVFNSFEHLHRLLESDCCEVVMAVLRVLYVLAVPRSTRQVVGDVKFTSKLSTLAASWGTLGATGERLMSITSCCLDDVSEWQAIGTTVHMEIYKCDVEKVSEGDSSPEEGLSIIHIEQAHTIAGSESVIFEDIVKKHSVPKDSLFELKTRLRLARSFVNRIERQQWVRIQIVALTVLAQCQSLGGSVPSLLSVNEGCIVELIDMLQNPRVLLDIQTLALRSLTALLSERSRQFSFLITANSTSHHGVLPSLIRKFKALITNPPSDMKEHIRFGESLLGLTWTFAGSNTGASALHNAGIVHMLVPMLRPGNQGMVKFLTLAVKTLEVLMNYSQDMQHCFRELDGVSVLVNLAYDVVLRLTNDPMNVSEGPATATAIPSHTEEYRFEHCRLLSSILHLLSAAATPVATTTDVRELASGTQLPFLLNSIFKQQNIFGAGVFEKAAALLTEFVHQEPGCLQQMITAGVAESFLSSIAGDYPPSRGVVNAIPSALGALCLSAAGTGLVEAAQPLERLLKSLSSERVVFYLHGDCPSNLGAHLEELMRHNPSLLESSMGGCVGLVSQIPSTTAAMDGSKGEPEISRHVYLITAVEFVGKFLEPLMSAAEHARSFIRRGGVKALLDVLSLEDLPKNFSRTEAGKYLVLVIGKAASHSPSEVLGDLIQRTVGFLKAIEECSPLRSVVETPAPVKYLEVFGEKKLLDLEMHTSLLAGVIASFRVSSAFSEWNSPAGSELLRLASKVFVTLRMAASLTAKVNAVSNQQQGVQQSNEEMEIGQDAHDVMPLPDRGDPLDPSTSKPDDILSQAQTALSALFSRLTSAIGAPSRRRPDDRVPQTSNEKAVGGVLASSLISLLEEAGRIENSSSRTRYCSEVVELLLICIVGDESQRSRSALNMVLLQELVDQEFLTKFGKFTSSIVDGILRSVCSEDSRDSENSCETTAVDFEDLFHVLSSCLSLVLRLLTSPFNTLDRTGTPVPYPGFDSAQFVTKLKVETFGALELLFRRIASSASRKAVWPPSVMTLLLEFAIQHLKVEPPQNSSASSGANAPPVRQYDPQTVTALMEMGFDERRVHAALDAVRSNSVELATEWLFVHGLGASGDDEDMARAMALSLEQDGGGSAVVEQNVSSTPTINEIRVSQSESLRILLLDVCLQVAFSESSDSSTALPFAIADALNILCQNENGGPIFSKLQDHLRALMASDSEKDGKRLGSLLHVISILVHDGPDCCRTAIDAGFLHAATEMLQKEGQRLNALAEAPVSSWVCPCMLVICALLKYLEDGKKIDVSDIKNQNSNAKEDVEVRGNSESEGKDHVVDSAIDVGRTQGEYLVLACIAIIRRKPDPLFNQATLQLLTRLTRIHRNAVFLLQSGAIQSILSCPSESSFSGQALLVGSILRHVLEDPQTLQTCMQVEIRAILTSLMSRNNGRALSLKAFLSAAATLAQRDPLVFSRAVCACCHITDNDSRRLIQLTDRKEEKALVSSVAEHSQRSELAIADMNSDLPNSKAAVTGKGKNVTRLPEASTQLIGILVEQMFALIPSKGAAPTAPSSSAIGDTNSSGAVDTNVEMDVDQPDASSSRQKASDEDEKSSTALTISNILRFLSELVKFFPGCSQAVIKCIVPCKQRVDGSKRHSEGLLGFLLCELLPGQVGLKGSEAALCSQRASQLIAALFGRGSDIRKKVVSEIIRAIQQPSSTSVRASKTNYLQRLHALGDLLAMLLSSTKHAQVSGHTQPDTAKFFLDAGLPATVAAALSGVDLQHPLAPKVANSLLRPLDVLCAIPSSARQRSDAADSVQVAEQPTSSGNDGGPSVQADTSDQAASRPAVVLPDNAPLHDSLVVETLSSSGTDSIRDNGLASNRVEDSRTDTGESTGAAVSSEAPDHHDRNSQGGLNRLMAVLRHMERDAADLDEDGSEGSDERSHGEGEDDEEDDHEHDEGSEDEESTLDVEEESDDDDDDDDDGAAGDHENGGDFFAEDIFSGDGHGQEEMGINWPRNHEIVINNEQELDHLVQRVMQHPQVRMTRNWNGELEGEAADVDMENDGQLLGFGMPLGSRPFVAHGHPSGLHEMFQDMHVIQFPGRASRSFVAGASGTSIRVAVNEGAASSHPFLSRGMQASGRFSRPGSTRSRMPGIDEYRALVQSAQSPAFLLSHLGGRLVLGDPSNQHLAREGNGADGGWSRWTDDGSGSTAAMRTLALGLETCLQSVLSSAQQLAVEGVTGQKPSASLSSESARNESSRVVEDSSHASSVAGASNTENANILSSSEHLALADIGAISETSAPAILSGDAEESTPDIIDERGLDDNDELALALRLSMETGDSSQLVAPAQHRGDAERETGGPLQELNESEVEIGPGSQGNLLPVLGAHTSDQVEDGAIDAAFLAELPDELRAEVIAQQSSQGATRWPSGAATQTNLETAGAEDGGIDPEFLAALPPDIQADVLRQHQRAQESAAAMETTQTSVAGDMDNGSFIATLSAELREEVLLTADESFIASLPPHLAAEAALLRERAYHARSAPLLNPNFASMGSRRNAPSATATSRPATEEQRIATEAELRQVLPCGSEKSVVRLVELSSGMNKGLLHSVLLHLCAHACTRSPTIRLLLAQALSPGVDVARGSVPFPTSAGLARRALEALCHLTALQPKIVPLLLDRTLLTESEHTAMPAPQYSGKGKNRADSRFEKASNRNIEAGSSHGITVDKGETNALDKMILRLAASDVLKNASTLDLFAQLILATVVAAKPPLSGQMETAPSIPVLGESAFRSLAVALGALGAGRQTGDRLMGALQALCVHEQNRRVCVPLLLECLRLAAVDCCKNLSSFDAADPQGFCSEVLENDESSYADLRFLRLAKTLRSVWITAPASKGPSFEQNAVEMSDIPSAAGDSRTGGDSRTSGDTKSTDVTAPTESALSSVVGEDSLWSLLSSCLTTIESQHTALSKATSSTSSISPALSRLQPLVEAYFVVHAPLNAVSGSGSNSEQPGAVYRSRSGSAPEVTSSSPAASSEVAAAMTRGRSGLASEASPRVEQWIEFAEKHRNALNSYLRQDKTLLQSSSTFAGLVAHPKLLDFDNKKAYFRAELKRRNASHRHGTLRVSVRREYVLEDSYHQMVLRRPDELKGRLHVTFQNEEGVDAGGLSREWFLTLSKQMLNPDKALFLPSVNGLTFQPNPASGIQPDHLGYFRFAGQVVAKALWDEQLLDAHFTLSLYKHILNQPIEVKDVESIDPEYYRNLGWMLENDITSVLEETFSIVREQFGEMLTIDLKPNGRNLNVTEANKHEYVQLVAEHVMTKGIREQVDAFKQGFHELIPSDLIQIFSPQELELLLCGLPSIDVDDLRANTEYTGYSRDSPQIQWFWSVVQGLSQEDLARLVQFVTGTSQVPMEGFQALRGMNGPQRFNIHRCGHSGRLPSSHTCFNQLDLPEYPSSEVLQRCLLSAIREGFEGFGFS